jgi:hypothetical protein
MIWLSWVTVSASRSIRPLYSLKTVPSTHWVGHREKHLTLAGGIDPQSTSYEVKSTCWNLEQTLMMKDKLSDGPACSWAVRRVRVRLTSKHEREQFRLLQQARYLSLPLQCVQYSSRPHAASRFI